MALQLTNSCVHALRAATLAGVLSLCAFPSHADSLFDNMRGSWSGGGTVSLSSGAKERIRCKASYSPSGSSVRMSLQCASDSYKFDLTSDISSSGDQITGTWYETTRQAQGNITGTATLGRIQATAVSAIFSAFLNVRTSGGSQSVSIQSPGSEISSITIALRR